MNGATVELDVYENAMIYDTVALQLSLKHKNDFRDNVKRKKNIVL